MPKRDFIKNITSELCSALPSHLKNVKKDVEKSFQHILNSGFSKLELVTKEEFDVQKKVLARTRQKLEELENWIKKQETANKKHHRKKDDAS